MSNPPLAVGIDLGTTFSAMASLDDAGKPQTVKLASGQSITPSVVHLDQTSVQVGRSALELMAQDAANVAVCAKREIGEPFYHKQLGGRRYPPEVLEAFILHQLVREAQPQIGEFDQAVVTVPAYFDEVRRKATQDAGYMAGLEVLDIINEPTAAALAYGVQQGFLEQQPGKLKSKQPMTLLAYDLGGGTFDVTIMRVDGKRFTTLATDGDVCLGGQDWDDRLVEFVAAKCLEQCGVDPREMPLASAMLWRACEAAKRRLSNGRFTSVILQLAGQQIEVDVTRPQFEELTHDLVDRTRFTVEETLRTSGLARSAIDLVLLVGGSTRMPMIREMLTALMRRQPDASLAVDEAVAHGAALWAGVQVGSHVDRSQPVVQNVNSHSLGVVGTEPETRRRRTAVILAKNTPLPASRSRRFRTGRGGQQSILVDVVEGESASPEECVALGRCIARDLPADLPAGTGVDVEFRYEANGRLHVAVGLTEGQELTAQELFRENMLTAEQLDLWKQYIAQRSP